MKTKYITPQTCLINVKTAEVLTQSQSQSVNASGQDFGDPVTVSDNDFNNIF